LQPTPTFHLQSWTFAVKWRRGGYGDFKMTIKQVEDQLTELVHLEPFIPFIVELEDALSRVVPHPPAFDENGAGFIGVDGGLVDFWFENVRAIKPMTFEPLT
jgi:hypothetical protein